MPKMNLSATNAHVMKSENASWLMSSLLLLTFMSSKEITMDLLWSIKIPDIFLANRVEECGCRRSFSLSHPETTDLICWELAWHLPPSFNTHTYTRVHTPPDTNCRTRNMPDTTAINHASFRPFSPAGTLAQKIVAHLASSLCLSSGFCLISWPAPTVYFLVFSQRF